MSAARFGMARVFELLERAHGIGSRGSECSGWMEQRLSSLLEGIAEARALDPLSLADKLEAEPKLLAEIADTLRVGETRFHRDPAQWRALREQVLPTLSVERVRAISVGCSTGEEAYTLAMILDQAARSFQGGFRVVGMDRSETALAAARAAIYPAAAASELPSELRARYLESAGNDAFSVARGLRAHVSFVTRDVMNGLPPGSYEIIVCKNMLIYFGEQARATVIESLLRVLSPGGALLVARSEAPLVRAFGSGCALVAPGVFALGSKASTRAKA
ncbi:MAG TPA: CheR family methyltransferase [Polyangiaceae bacterium]|jgi:chemotaxis methyl-accepting protein methylase|nr:CheR family methyltransferase [Polyangiaceae bacterium]